MTKVGGAHPEPMSHILVVPKWERQISLSRDGTIAIWSADTARSHWHKSALVGVTDVLHLSSTRKVDNCMFVASNGTVSFCQERRPAEPIECRTALRSHAGALSLSQRAVAALRVTRGTAE